MAEYGENICKAIDEIVKKRLSQIKCDITKSCKIVELKDRNIYKYIVSDGAMEFEAYGSHEFYENGSFVLVQIPQGNYSFTKIIIGRDLNKEIVNNSSPFAIADRELSLYSHWGTEDNKIYNLKANGDTAEKELLFVEDLTDLDFSYYDYNQFSISGDFFSNIKKKNIVGEFGIKVLITNDEGKIFTYSFNNIDMANNGFYYDSFVRQRKTFALNTENFNIKQIQVKFYQSKGTFYYNNENNEKVLLNSENSISDDLFVKNLQLILGRNEIKINDDIVSQNFMMKREKSKRLIDISNQPFEFLSQDQFQKKIIFKIKENPTLTTELFCLYE